LLSAGFYGLLQAGLIEGQLINQYFASHPVEYVAATLFFVGMAALGTKWVDMASQRQWLGRPLLPTIPAGGQPVADCTRLQRQLSGTASGRHYDYLIRRLHEALEYVRRKNQADTLEDQLKYLADLDAARLHSSYSLVRVIIWAIPILGFLGTVIGITMAIANLAPDAVEDSLPQVIGGLSVAFATTTQALALSIVLMFAQFLTERSETRLLEQVDQQAEAEMVGRFQVLPPDTESQLAGVRLMADKVIEAADQLVQRQAKLWQESMQAAETRWSKMAAETGAQVQKSLSNAMAEGLQNHAQALTAAEQSLAESNQRHWDKLQQTAAQGNQSLTELQQSMSAQAESLRRAVAAVGEVTTLEQSLNRNLNALAGARNFEQTVNSLAAAIHLLNGRLGSNADDAPRVQLQPSGKPGQAA
jgi:biopolymer transport protein ExbB/TolQ